MIASSISCFKFPFSFLLISIYLIFSSVVLNIQYFLTHFFPSSSCSWKTHHFDQQLFIQQFLCYFYVCQFSTVLDAAPIWCGLTIFPSLSKDTLVNSHSPLVIKHYNTITDHMTLEQVNMPEQTHIHHCLCIKLPPSCQLWEFGHHKQELAETFWHHVGMFIDKIMILLFSKENIKVSCPV